MFFSSQLNVNPPPFLCKVTMNMWVRQTTTYASNGVHHHTIPALAATAEQKHHHQFSELHQEMINLMFVVVHVLRTFIISTLEHWIMSTDFYTINPNSNDMCEWLVDPIRRTSPVQSGRFDRFNMKSITNDE